MKKDLQHIENANDNFRNEIKELPKKVSVFQISQDQIRLRS